MRDRERGVEVLPRVAVWLLQRWIPADMRMTVVRDLEEMANTELARRTRVGVRVWVWCQVLSFCARFSWERVHETVQGRLFDVSMRHAIWWSSVDIRYTVRTLVRSPVLTASAVLSLAVGVALPVTAFSVLNAMFLQPLPFPDGDRVVRLRDVHAGRGYELDLTAAEYERRRERLSSYEVLAAYDLETVDITVDEAAAGIVAAAHVTPELFELAGTTPVIGRVITAADVAPGAAPVAMIAEGVWRQGLGGDAAVAGRMIRVKGKSYTVIGVMPSRFGFPGERVEVWLPLSTRAGATPAATANLKVAGLLRPGVSLRRAESELTAVLPPERSDVESGEVVLADVTPFTRGSVSGPAIGFAWALVFALVLLLLASSANVANLLLARNAARTGELAVRAALGASRGRLFAQLLMEATMLAAGATLTGLGLARMALVRLQGALVLPAWSRLDIDARVLLFSLSLALLAALACGLGPAWKTTRPQLHSDLKSAGRGRGGAFGRLSGALIVTELCLSVALLGVAAIFARGVFEFGRTAVSLPASNVLVAQLYWGQPPQLRGGSSLNADQRRAAWAAYDSAISLQQARIAELISEGANVRAVTYASHVPGMPLQDERVDVEGEGVARVAVTTRVVGLQSGFFRALDVRVLAGRDFSEEEARTQAAVAIVNESFAHRYFGGPFHALGRRVRRQSNATELAAWHEIVGVVPDAGLNPGDPARADGLYVPLDAANPAELLVRTHNPADAVLSQVTDAVRSVNADIEVQWTSTLDDAIGLPARVFRAVALGFVMTGVVALLLSMLSLYAIMAFSVTHRTREIGIRIAIGATYRSIPGTVLGRGLRQILLGIALGILLSIALARFALSTIPFDLAHGGVLELSVITLLLASAGFGACFRPVRRVLNLDPILALRAE